MRYRYLIIIGFILTSMITFPQVGKDLTDINGHDWNDFAPEHKTSYMVGFCTGVWALQAIQAYSGMNVLDDPFDLRSNTIGEVIREVDLFYALGPEYLDIPVYMAIYLRKDQYKKENL